MNTDDLQVLAHRADDVRGREAVRLAEVHARIHDVRRRRQMGVATGLALVLVAGVVVTALALRPHGDPRPAPVVTPSPSPTKTASPSPLFVPSNGTQRLSLRQTVHSYNADLVDALAAPDDSDVRLSIWHTVCEACPAVTHHRGQPSYWAMAVTRDGYRTTHYLRIPAVGNVPEISSPASGTFLLAENSNGWYWLLSADGKLRRVTLVDEQRRPDDPRLVFGCLAKTANGVPADPASAAGRAWCVVDVRAATAAVLPETWDFNGGPDSDPRLGQEPWGMDDNAWWLDRGTRHSVALPQGPVVGSIPGLGRHDGPVYFHWTYGEHTMLLYVVRDRSRGLGDPVRRPWLPLTRAEMGRPMDSLSVEYARTPDGALMAWSEWTDETQHSRLRIWRAKSLLRGEFRLVYDSSANALAGLDLRRERGRLYLGPLVSDDDGRTWGDPVDRWR